MTYQSILDRTSPNFSYRSAYGNNGKPTAITVHHWGTRGQRFENVVDWLCNPAAGTSAHYVVEDGRVACIVEPDLAAWHSGSNEGNGQTIGLELRPEATDGDYATAAALIRDLREVYGDLPLYPHKHWFNTACPGVWDLERLDRLARVGKGSASIGLQGENITVIEPETKEEEEDDMALTDEDLNKIADRVLDRIVKTDEKGGTNTLRWFLASQRQGRAEDVKAIVDGIFTRTFKRQGPGESGETTWGAVVAWYDANMRKVQK